MKQKFQFLCVCILINTIALSQGSFDDLQGTKPPQLDVVDFGYTYNSLDHSSLVNHATGGLNYSVPLYTIANQDIQLNLSASYHTTGFRPSQYGSEIGLGWSINGLPAVTRTVNGIPDDERGGEYKLPFQQIQSTTFNFFYNCAGNFYSNSADVELSSLGSNLDNAIFLFKLATGILDGEHDVFSVNIEGAQIKFVIQYPGESKDDIVLLLGDPNYLIDFERYEIGENPNPFDDSRWIKSFSVETPSGKIYGFNKPGTVQNSGLQSAAYGTMTTSSYSIGTPSTTPNFTHYYARPNHSSAIEEENLMSSHNTWYLTSINSKVTGATISIDLIPTIEIHGSLGSDRAVAYIATNAESGQSYFYTVTNFTGALTYTLRYLPEVIEFGGGKLEFDYSTGERLDLSPVLPITQNGSFREPASGSKELDKITLYDENNQKVKSTRFALNYFEGSNSNSTYYDKRLCLDFIETTYYDESDNPTVDPNIIKFGYKNSDHKVPDALSLMTDIWGFYCQNFTTPNSPSICRPQVWDYSSLNQDGWGSPWSAIPRNTTDAATFNTGSSQRSPNFENSSSFLLNEIEFPLKGKIKIDYELNQFTSPDGLQLNGGGVRVAEIEFEDNSTVVKRVNYDYTDEGGLSSGKIFAAPIFKSFGDHIYAGEYTHYAPVGRSIMHQGSPVVYQQVKEIIEGHGSTTLFLDFEYDDFSGNGFSCDGSGENCLYEPSQGCFTTYRVSTSPNFFVTGNLNATTDAPIDLRPYAPLANFNDYQGKVTRKKYKNEAGVLLKEEIFDYTLDPASTVLVWNRVSKYYSSPYITMDYDVFNDTYPHIGGWQKLNSVTTKLYGNDGSGPLTSTTSFGYDSNRTMNYKEELHSDGERRFESYTHNYDFDLESSTNPEIGLPINELNEEGMVKKVEKITGIIDNADQSIEKMAELYTYKDLQISSKRIWNYSGSNTYTSASVLSNELDYDNELFLEELYQYYPNTIRFKEIDFKRAPRQFFAWQNSFRDEKYTCIGCSEGDHFYTSFEVPTNDVQETTLLAFSGNRARQVQPSVPYSTLISFSEIDHDYFVSFWLSHWGSFLVGEPLIDITFQIVSATDESSVLGEITFEQKKSRESNGYNFVSQSFNSESILGTASPEDFKLKVIISNNDNGPSFARIDEVIIRPLTTDFKAFTKPSYRDRTFASSDNGLANHFIYDEFRRLIMTLDQDKFVRETSEYNIR